MKKLCLIVLLANSPCFAQTLANAMMPDGSRDTYMGLALVSKPSSEGDAGASDTLLFPLLQVQWSNGVFVSGLNTLGMHLSDTPGVEYGPVLHWQEGRSPGIRRELAGSAELKGSPNVGGFFNYYLGHDFRLTSELLSTTDAAGMLLSVGLQRMLPRFASHHSVSVSVGATAADSAYAQRRYGVTGISTTTSNVTQGYTPTGGLLNVNIGMGWNWALSASWLVSTGLSATYYTSIAADSPVIGMRSAVSMSSGLAYRF
jgi:outer membrane scaffolding protein for murein synthesis (MipA/OmpV family)